MIESCIPCRLNTFHHIALEYAIARQPSARALQMVVQFDPCVQILANN